MRLPQFAVGGAGVLAALVLPAAWMAAGCSRAAPAAAARPAPAAAARPGPAAPAGSFRPGQLSAVAAISARAAWAVGVTTGREPLIERWDGRAWSKVPSPDLGRGFVPLQGVAALSARDAWAVGEIAVGGHTLILHWDGKRWQRARSPSPSQGGGLTAVAATSASSAWAVGSAVSSSILSTTLIEHWDGRTWKHVPSPAPEPDCGGCQFPGDSLSGVAATSASNAWAVGGTGRGAPSSDGTAPGWRWVRGPAGSGGGALEAVAALSATDAWAVGTIDGKTLTEHWDGKTWTRVPSPSPARPSSQQRAHQRRRRHPHPTPGRPGTRQQHPDLALGRRQLTTCPPPAPVTNPSSTAWPPPPLTAPGQSDPAAATTP